MNMNHVIIFIRIQFGLPWAPLYVVGSKKKKKASEIFLLFYILRWRFTRIPSPRIVSILWKSLKGCLLRYYRGFVHRKGSLAFTKQLLDRQTPSKPETGTKDFNNECCCIRWIQSKNALWKHRNNQVWNPESKKKAKVINFLQVLIAAADIIILTTCKFNLPLTSQGVIFYDLNKNTLII